MTVTWEISCVPRQIFRIQNASLYGFYVYIDFTLLGDFDPHIIMYSIWVTMMIMTILRNFLNILFNKTFRTQTT